MPSAYEISKRNYVKWWLFRNKQKLSGLAKTEASQTQESNRGVIKKDFNINTAEALWWNRIKMSYKSLKLHLPSFLKIEGLRSPEWELLNL